MKTLEDYRKKRDFRKTAEPSGEESGRGQSGELSFVVQKHDARRLHYDFRLEWDGVLKSWAVPKGPSDNPSDKRLAVMVEDHPLDYADFEGEIPRGEYGAGTVIVWDRGTWEPEGKTDPGEALEKGSLKFTLRGEKLKGSWTLTRMKGSDGDNDWLLIKHKDRWASPDADTAIVDREPASVATGRTIEEAGAGEAADESTDPEDVPKSRAAKMLSRPFAPELATLVDAAPEGDDWLHEMKYDGYRILARKQGNKVELLSRNDKDWTDRFAVIAEPLKNLPLDVVMDGEVVVLEDSGLSSFQELQRALKGNGETQLTYYVFDLLWCDGRDLRGASLIDRKAALRGLLDRSRSLDRDVIRYSDHVRGNGPGFFEKACDTGLEGIMSKKASSSYRGKRTREWVKVKCTRRQEFVIGDFTEPSRSREGFGALLLGVYDEDDKLLYAGRVGTGFDHETLGRLRKKLNALARKTTAFDDPPKVRGADGVTWVRPELVGEVAFTEWTSDGRLRHPSFQGLREDKKPADVRRERTKPTESATDGAGKKKTSRKSEPASKGGKSPSKGEATVCGIEITSAERPVFPDAGITKGEVAEYYADVAAHLLPHVADRPLSVVRCPSGRKKQCFYQKHHSPGMPDAIGAVSVTEKEGKADYLTVDSAEGLVALAQFGVLEIHPWLSRNDRLDRPDLMVFDLDPSEDVDWEEVLGAAYLLRDILAGFDLDSFPKLTGGKGLHVVVPMTRRLDFETIKPAAKGIVERVRKRNPDKFLITASKAKRKGKIFLDYLRNGRGATAVAPFSLRSRPGAPVAVPLAWKEVGPALRPNQYDIKSLPRRLSSLKRDPWDGFFDINQSLKKSALRELGVE
ncbi:MAG: DNA ligase D [Verrucomicrobiales bacterium]